ncbi:hypothetical protein F4680DRAFT_412240 [Xylaria scruposa]|nr:hypothetical protein F4680DRAFT_412240 [Xylaria scruposa]
MPSNYYDHRHRDGYELAHQLDRDFRHSHRPTQYLINDGKLVLSERAFKDFQKSSGSNYNTATVIYNSPKSTMYIDSQKEKSHYPECRSCHRRRGRYNGYCSECYDRSRRHETITVGDHRYLAYPERKMIKWRQ